MLSVKNLHVRFEGDTAFHALQGISFAIPAGKTLALIGQSGSGKSLTSLAIMGLLPKNAKTTGYIALEGKEELVLSKLQPKEWAQVRGNKVGMVFQEPMSALNPIKSVGEQLQESILAHQNIGKKEAKILALQWMNKVKLPDPPSLFNRFPHQISGGQKQRIMIAMAMSNNPSVLIADEPTTALDVTVQKEIIQLMKQLQEEFGTAMLFITHDLNLAKLIADQIIVLEKGKVVSSMAVPTFMRSDDQTLPQEVLLSVAHLKVYYPQKTNVFGKVQNFFKAVDDVSFQIHKGETLGLVGESGCGKSTLSKCILGLQKATEGHIFYRGKDLTQLSKSEWQDMRKQIQIIFQDPYASLNPRIKIGDALAEPMRIHQLAQGKSAREKVVHLLAQVNLPADAVHKYPHEFSGGQRQRICIARALAVQPELIICDESVSALDVKIQVQILELLHHLQQQNHLTYLFITHDLQVVKSFCDRIMVMQKGKIVEIGSTEQIMHHPQQDYTKKLLASAPRLLQ